MATASPRQRTVFLEGLNSPFGMALVGDDLYVANTDAVLRFPYADGRDARSRRRRQKVVDLPAGPINHHWTKNLIASATARKLYVTVGSNSNVAREAAWRPRTGARRSGRSTPRPARTASSRRACAIPTAWPGSRGRGALWTVVNERDELGSDLVPDYLTSVRDGAFYGWPYSYYGQHVDERVTAAAARPGGDGDRAGLRARAAHRVARPGVIGGQRAAAALRQRHVRRPARLVEPPAAQRLQGDLRAVRRRQAHRRAADRRADRLPQRRRRCVRPAGRRGDRPARARCSWPTTSAM